MHVEQEDTIAKFWLDPIRLQRSGGFSRVEIGRIESIISANHVRLMEAVEINVPAVETVAITDEPLTVELSDGRSLTVPLQWFPRLVHATQKERNKWRLIARGQGIHWEDLDEDISIEGLLAGRPSGESQQSLKNWLNRRFRPTRRSNGRSSKNRR
jgi:hypothetical protein